MGKQFKFIILICLAISAVSIFYIFRSAGIKPAGTVKYPLPQAVAQLPNGDVVGSPDGKWSVTMKKEKEKDDVLYKFLVTGPDFSNKEMFAKTLPTGNSLSIPKNTFSPDDKYLFLKESTPNGNGYLVFTTSGEPLYKNAQEMDFVPLFSAKHENYKITDATGWGGMNLIVFNTDKASGGIGPSFWYEVPSGAFIQLNNRFN